MLVVASEDHEVVTEWDGVTKRTTLKAPEVALRDQLANAAHAYDWEQVIALCGPRQWVNVTRLGSRSGYAPLHQAAHAGAPTAIVEQLLQLGAWRTLRTAAQARAVDIARTHGHTQLIGLLEPVLVRDAPGAQLFALQKQFHALINSNHGALVEEYALRLPQIDPMLEVAAAPWRFPVPGMYGHYQYELDLVDGTPQLRVIASSRMDYESPRFLVTPSGFSPVGA